jgi:hypothetical protein
MINRVWILVLLVSLWGCGPEQTSADRDQQQADALAAQQKAQYDPYVGTYLGVTTLTTGQTRSTSVYLNPVVNPTPNIGRGDNTPLPGLQGALRFCLSSGCYDQDPNNEVGSKVIALTGANYDRNNKVMNIVSGTPSPTCVSSNGSDCSQYALAVKLTPTGLTGFITNGNGPVGQFTLTKVR